MSSKETYCYRLLKKHSLIVDFEDEVDLDYSSPIPDLIPGETYGAWKARVLGQNVSNVVIYTPSTPLNETKINTLQNQAGADHLENIFKAINLAGKIEKKTAVDKAIQHTALMLTSFSRGALEDLVATSDVVLEPPVKEFVDRFLNAGEPDIDVEKIIGALLKAYNDAVRVHRIKSVTEPS